MALFAYDTFADALNTDLTAHAGQMGAAYARHPATASSTGTWLISDAGRAYSTADTYSGPLAAHYLLSGSPDGDEHDVVAVWRNLAHLGDAYHGFTFKYHATSDSGYKLIYQSYSGFRRWVLQRMDGGTPTDLGSPYAHAFTAGTNVTIRVELRTTGITVKFDGVGQITSADATYMTQRRVGLYGLGSPGASNTTGMHLDRLAVGSVGQALPDYEFTGPSSAVPLVASAPFTVTLAADVNPGSVAITPSTTGTLAGAFTPTSVTLTDAERSGTFTFTPSASGSGTIAVSSGGVLGFPPALDFAAGLFDPSRLAAWRAIIADRHTTGTRPYVVGTGYDPDGQEHYDPIRCVYNAQDDFRRRAVEPQDWPDQIAAAVVRYRDRYVLVAWNAHLYHVNTPGLARHYYETGDPLDLTAVGIMLSGGYNSLHADTFGGMNAGRENAFMLMGMLDREWLGLGSHPNVDDAAFVALGHIEQWVGIATGLYYGSWCKPFMAGLAMMGLIAYWERYRNTGATGLRASNLAAIPAAIKDMLGFIWDHGWIPPDDANPSWTHGALVYATPATDDSSMAPITGLTIGTVTSQGVFTLVGTLSSTDDKYRYSGLVIAGYPGDVFVIADYVGATKQVTLTNYRPGGTLIPGTACSIQPADPEPAVGPGPSPPTNHMVVPAFAWAYWHEKVIEGNTAAANVYRVRHDAIFDGGELAWSANVQQKQWNQSLWAAHLGLEYRARGDSEYPAATALTLEAPATGAAGLHSVASGPFRVSVPYGTKLGGPKVVTPASDTGLGTFNPTTAVLTDDRPYALFTFDPDVLDDASVVNITATASGFTADSPVTYAVGDVATAPLIGPIYSAAGGVLYFFRP